MNNKAWLDKVRALSKEGKQEEAARVVRRVLEKDRYNYEALWIMANISTSHPERYAALKIYEELSQHWALKHIDTARHMLIEYERHAHMLNEFKAEAPIWSKDKNAPSDHSKNITGFLFDGFPYLGTSSDDSGFGCFLTIVILLVFYLIKLMPFAMRFVADLISGFVRFIRRTFRSKAKRKK